MRVSKYKVLDTITQKVESRYADYDVDDYDEYEDDDDDYGYDY